MRAGVHMALTFAAAVVGAIGSLILFVGVALHAAEHDWPRLASTATLAIPLCGLLLPTWLMRFVPCRCPRCGGKARLGVAATELSILPLPRYAWSCTACDWSTYYWSSYQQKW